MINIVLMQKIAQTSMAKKQIQTMLGTEFTIHNKCLGFCFYFLHSWGIMCSKEYPLKKLTSWISIFLDCFKITKCAVSELAGFQPVQCRR